jgi:protein phosphatase 1 regulatory subunit 11
MSAHPPTFTRQREQTEPANDGSRTITLDPIQTESESEPEDDSIGILRLRGDPSARSPRQIQWADNVVDNELLNRKKSKSEHPFLFQYISVFFYGLIDPSFAVCCIYHRPRMPGDDSSSDSSSDSDSESDSPNNKGGDGDHEHEDDCNHHHHGRGRSKKSKQKLNPREVSPNAYERQPRYKSMYTARHITRRN